MGNQQTDEKDETQKCPKCESTNLDGLVGGFWVKVTPDGGWDGQWRDFESNTELTDERMCRDCEHEWGGPPRDVVDLQVVEEFKKQFTAQDEEVMKQALAAMPTIEKYACTQLAIAALADSDSRNAGAYKEVLKQLGLKLFGSPV